jgi:HEAT repeat protein
MALPFVIIAVVAAAACGSDAPDNQQDAAPPTGLQTANEDPFEEVQQALNHEDRNRRLDTAWTLTQRDDIPAPIKAQLLLDAIEREIRQPTLGAAQGSYLTATEWSSYVYTRALGKIAPGALAALRDTATNETGELRARAVLALGYAGQREVIADLQDLLRSSAIGDVRSEAAHLLGDLGAQEAIPDLRQAALDTHSVRVDSPGGGRKFFPVRESALRALESLGLTIELTEEGEYRIVEQ